MIHECHSSTLKMSPRKSMLNHAKKKNPDKG
jgi:hypothetical protein